MKFMFSKMLSVALLFSTLQSSAQNLTTPVDGGNRKASVSERMHGGFCRKNAAKKHLTFSK